MKLRMLVTDCDVKAGEIVEVGNKMGKEMIEHKMAELVENTNNTDVGNACMKNINNTQMGNAYKKLVEISQIRLAKKEELPTELTEAKCWLNWKYGINEKGERIKMPLAPWRTQSLYGINAHDPANLTAFDVAEAWAKKNEGDVGLAFEFNKATLIAGCDFDKCVENGKITTELVQEVLDKAGTYAEISPSGRGIHVIFKQQAKRKAPLVNHVANVEVYDEKRYFAITGDRWEASPTILGENEGLLDELYKKYAKPKFELLPEEKEGKHYFAIEKLLGEEWLKTAKHQGDLVVGAHPVHGSKRSGTNFHANLKEGWWHCFAHGVGGHEVEWLAVKEGFINCEDVGKKGHRLVGDVLQKVLARARELGLVDENASSRNIFFNDKDEFVPKWLADKLKRNRPFVTHLESWITYGYKEGVYVPEGEALIRETCRFELGELAKEHFASETYKQIRDTTFTPHEKFDVVPELLCIKNGILNVKTKELKPHTPNLIFLQKLDVAHNPGAKCPITLKTLFEWTDLKGVVQILQFIGFCLYRNYFIRKAFIIHGEGANGKTTFILFLTGWLGQKNVASVKVQSLENRFTAMRLYGKLANLSDELPEDEWENSGAFKALTGSSPIEAEKKFKDEFSYISYAKQLFTGNKMPIVSDDTNAFWDRVQIINFSSRFTEEKNKEGIVAAMLTEEEKSGLLNLALKGLDILLKTGRFYRADDIETARTKYLAISDPVMAFARLRTADDPVAKTIKSTIYGSYVKYCNDNGFPVKASNAFALSFARCYPNLLKCQVDVAGVRHNAWQGVKLVTVGNEIAEATPNSAQATQDTHVFSLIKDIWDIYPHESIKGIVQEIADKENKPVYPVQPVENSIKPVQQAQNPIIPQKRELDAGTGEKLTTQQVQDRIFNALGIGPFKVSALTDFFASDLLGQICLALPEMEKAGLVERVDYSDQADAPIVWRLKKPMCKEAA